MCGVPHHSAQQYIRKLLDLGHRVALCEQVEDPRLAKGIVKREVVRIVTPGVVLDEEQLEAKVGNFLAAIESSGGQFGLAFLDVTTGEFRATLVRGRADLEAEIARARPREIIGTVPEGLAPPSYWMPH